MSAPRLALFLFATYRLSMPAIAGEPVATAPPEPTYQGKAASEWSALLQSPDVEVRRQTVVALRAIAPGADLVIPALGRALDDDDRDVRLGALKSLSVLASNFEDALDQLGEALSRGDSEVRKAALAALADVAQKGSRGLGGGRAYVPFRNTICLEVVRLLAEEDAAARVAALGLLDTLLQRHPGPDGPCRSAAIAALPARLRDANADARLAAVRLLKQSPREAPRPLLIGLLGDPDRRVAVESASVLAIERPEPGVTIAALARAQDSDDVQLRRLAITSTSSCTFLVQDDERFRDTVERDRAALGPYLKRALGDGDAAVHNYVQMILRQLGPAALRLPGISSGDIPSTRPDSPAPAAPVISAPEAPVSSTPAGVPPDERVLDAMSVGQLVEILRSGIGPQPARAASALSKRGAAAMAAAPDMLDLVETGDFNRRTLVQDLLRRLSHSTGRPIPGVARRIRAANPPVQITMLKMIAGFGPAAHWAASAARDALRDENADVRLAAALALVEVGKSIDAALPVLFERLASESATPSANVDGRRAPPLGPGFGNVGPLQASGSRGSIRGALHGLSGGYSEVIPRGVQVDIIGALSKVPAGTPGYVDGILALLERPEAWIRSYACFQCRRLESAETVTVPRLALLVQDDDPQIRAAAAMGLGGAGTMAATAVPLLLRAMKDPFQEVRSAAIESLGRIGPAAAPGLDALVQASLVDPEMDPQGAGSAALWGLGPAAAPAVPTILGALQDPSTRPQATRALEKITPAVTGAASMLGNALDATDASGRVVILQALRRFGPDAAPAIPGIVRACDSDALEVRSAAVAALGAVGPQAGSAVPALVDLLLKETDNQLRWTSAETLWRLGPAAAEAVPTLIAALSERNGSSGVSDAFARIVPVSPAVVAHLVEGLSTADDSIRGQLLIALGNLGPAAVDAVPALVDLLHDPDRGFHSDTLTTLGRIGPEAYDAAPAVADILSDGNENYRRIAAETLGRIGSRTRAARKALLHACRDANEDVRGAAVESLERLGWDIGDCGGLSPGADLRRAGTRRAAPTAGPQQSPPAAASSSGD